MQPWFCIDSLSSSWKHLLKLWSAKKQQLSREHLTELCSMYTEETLKHLLKKFADLTASEKAQKEYYLVFTMLSIFDVSVLCRVL